MKKKTCRIGIVGAGRIGRLHAENILFHLPQFELVAIADPQIDRNWAEKLGIAIVSNQSEDVLCHPDLDAILIASPSHLHLEQIITASIHEKAIFCEKPIGLNEEEIDKTLNIIKTIILYCNLDSIVDLTQVLPAFRKEFSLVKLALPIFFELLLVIRLVHPKSIARPLVEYLWTCLFMILIWHVF